MNDLSVDVSQSKVAAAVAIGQTFVVKPHQVQDCGVEVVNVDSVFNSVKTELIRRPIGEPTSDAASGQPHRKGVRVVVTTRSLASRRSAELASPDDQRFVQQSSRFQVGQQGRDGLIAGRSDFFVIAYVGVAVPLAADIGNYVPNTSLDKSTGQQSLAAVV